MKCEYCGTHNDGKERCAGCGAPLSHEVNETKSVVRSGPDFFNGYIVYWLNNPWEDMLEVQFWLGHDLIERFQVSRTVLRELVPEGQDALPFFWDLLLVAQGEKEVLRIKEKNSKLPATFEIRRVENEMKAYYGSLNREDLARALRK